MTDRYMEFVGGLGDAILRLYFSGQSWYGALEGLGPDERAVVVLMCHNSNLSEIFEWHPKRDRIKILDLGFDTAFHPWENEEWRLAHFLPKEAPCPPYTPSETLKFYPGPEDRELLDWLKDERFLVLNGTAGTDDRTVPEKILHDAARAALDEGYRILLVGKSRYFRGARNSEIDKLLHEDVVNAVDWLSVPGTIEAVKLSAGVIVAHTSVLHMAWSEKRPVFLLYNKWMKETMIPSGPVGYMQGINRKDTDHMEFSEYTRDRFLKWMGKL